MNAELQIAVDVLALAVGFALVLWGFRIYRVWVAFIGFLLGGALGVTVAAFTAESADAMAGSALLAGLLGAFLAWPFHKLVAFLAGGATGAVLAALASGAWLGSGAVTAVAIAAFIIAGVLSVRFLKATIGVAMAITGATAVFFAVFVPSSALSGDATQIGQRLLDVLIENASPFAVTTAMFVGLALWMHRGHKRTGDGRPSVHDAYGRGIAWRFAALILLAWTLAAVLSLSQGWQVSSFELMGMHPLSWPLVTIGAVIMTRVRRGLVPARPAEARAAAGNGEDDTPAIEERSTHSHVGVLSAIAFSLLVMPLLTALVFMTFGASWDVLAGFYRAFGAGPAASIATKCGLSLAVLPLAMAGAARSAARSRRSLDTDEPDMVRAGASMPGSATAPRRQELAVTKPIAASRSPATVQPLAVTQPAPPDGVTLEELTKTQPLEPPRLRR